MAFKEREGNFWAPEKEGDSLEGKLVGIRQGTYGRVYDVETSKEGIKTIPTATWLENRIFDSDIGKKIRVTFNGTDPAKVKGHNPVRKFKVEFDEA